MIRNLATIVKFTSIVILLSPIYISAQQKTEDPPLPPKRAHHSLAFDAKLGEVVLYGGSTPAENDTFTFFDDLWSWNGRRWNRLALTGLSRSSHDLIYDAARKRLLLIGGMAGQQRYGDIRAFDGKSWVAVHDNPALALSEPAVAVSRWLTILRENQPQSNCVRCQAETGSALTFQSLLSRTITLMMVRSFRIQATMATFLSLFLAMSC